MDIVCLGVKRWGESDSCLEQYLPLLAARGHRVLYVEPQSEGSTKEKLMPIRPRFAVYHAGVVGEDAQATRLKAVLARSSFHNPVVINASPDFGKLSTTIGAAVNVYAPLQEPQESLVQDAPVQSNGIQSRGDDHSSQGHRIDQLRFAESEREFAARCQLALCLTDSQNAHLNTFHNNVIQLSPGVDLEHFSAQRMKKVVPHPVLRQLPGPVVGFIGRLSSKVDYHLLLDLAQRRPDWQIVVLSRRDTEVSTVELLRKSSCGNLHLFAPVASDQLPRLVKHIDLLIAPYRDDATIGSEEIQSIYSYLGAGRPVIASPAVVTRELQNIVRVAKGVDAYISTIEQLLSTSSNENRGDHQLKFAVRNSWQHCCDRLEEALEDVFAQTRQSLPARVLPSLKKYWSQTLMPRSGLYVGDAPSIKLRALFAMTSAAGFLYWLARGSPSPAKPETVKRILISRGGRLGDTIAFLPALRALRRRFPKAQITLITGRKIPGIELVQQDGLVDELREVNFFATEGLLMNIKACARLVAEGFDILIAGPSFMKADEGYFSGAPFRIGLDDDNPYALFSNRRVTLDPSCHEAENSLSLVEGLGCKAAPARRRPTLPSLVQSQAENPATELLKRLNIDPRAELLAIHAGAANASRQWPKERFAELARLLLKEDIRRQIVFTGIKSELPLIESICSTIEEPFAERVRIAAGKTNLDEFKLLLDEVRLFVCNDTGAMHVARAQGVGLLALLGPENHRRWGPHPMGRAPAHALRHRAPCAPCLKTQCAQLYCLKLLQVEEVAKACSSMLQSSELQAKSHRSTEPKNYPLAVTLNEHSWGDLSEQFEVFKTSVVFCGVNNSEDGSKLQATLSTLDAIAAQDYPRLELALVNVRIDAEINNRIAAFKEVGVPIRIVTTTDQSIAGCLAAAVGRLNGEFVVVATPGDNFTSTKISEDVAALFCNAKSAAAMSYPQWLTTSLRKQTALTGGVTVRSKYLRAMLKEGRNELPVGGQQPIVCSETLTIL